MRTISVKPLTANAFAPFGDVLEVGDKPSMIINQGQCGRYHDLAKIDFADGRAGVSLFDAEPRALPYELDMVERHPLGSQAFIPMTQHPFLVVVAADDDGAPAEPVAFITDGSQAVNYHRNTWHGVLSPLHTPGLFAVVDRIGDGNNLEEFWFDEPFTIVGA